MANPVTVIAPRAVPAAIAGIASAGLIPTLVVGGAVVATLMWVSSRTGTGVRLGSNVFSLDLYKR